MRVSKLLMPAVTLAGALALAGCGGGSGGGSGGPCDHGANDDGTCRPDPNIALRTTANTEISEAIAAAAGLGSSPSAADVAAARTAYDEAVAAINALPSGERNAQLGRLVTANGQIALHEGVQVRGDAAYAETLIAALNTGTAGTVGTARRDNVGPFVTVTPKYNAAPGVSASKLNTPGSGTPGDSTASTAVDPAFKLDSANPAASIDGWKGHAFAREESDGATETLWVYENIGAPASKPFAEVYSGLDATNTQLDAAIAGVVSDGFAKRGTIDHDASGQVRSFPGTFRGASGTYKCTTDCTSSRTDSGGLVLSDGWRFTAATGSTVNMADADYLYFGGWLRDDRHEEAVWLHAFAGGGTPFEASGRTTDTTAQGSATYKGGAAGMYAIDRLGVWTAKSELTAKFGNTDSTEGSISGKIHDFMSGGQSMPWEVTLNDNGATPNIQALTSGSHVTAASTTTWKIGGEAASERGTWTGSFYGDGSGDYEGQPSGVAGTFSANYGSTGDDHTGRMSGAFGATQ